LDTLLSKDFRQSTTLNLPTKPVLAVVFKAKAFRASMLSTRSLHDAKTPQTTQRTSLPWQSMPQHTQHPFIPRFQPRTKPLNSKILSWDCAGWLVELARRTMEKSVMILRHYCLPMLEGNPAGLRNVGSEGIRRLSQ